HTAFGEIVAHPWFHRAQILTDHHGPGTVGLQRYHRDHRLVVVVHVGALVRGGALGDPPQAEQAHHVVDAQRTGVAYRGPDHLPQRPVGGIGQGVRTPRRLRPVLPLLVVHVRRCTHAHA